MAFRPEFEGRAWDQVWPIWYQETLTPPPPMTGAGGGEDLTASCLHLRLTPPSRQHSDINLQWGRVNLVWARAPWCKGEDATYSTLGQEHCLKDRGHRWQMEADSCAVPERVAITEYELSSNNGWMNVYCKETFYLENPMAREVIEPSNCWMKLFKLLMVARYPEYNRSL